MNTRAGLILVAGIGIAVLGVVMGAAAFIAAPILLVAAVVAGLVWWAERRREGKEPGHSPRDHP